MEHAPQVVEFYNKHVARNPKIDMVLCPQDKNTEGLNKLQGAYPLPTLALDAMKNRQKIPTIYRHLDRKMGWLLAIDREGKVVVDGDSEPEKLKAFIENGCRPVENE